MKVRCPHCGNDDLTKIQWQEWIPVSRPILAVRDGKIEVDGDAEQLYSEEAKNESLYCNGCFEAFPIPEGVIIDHLSGVELALRARGETPQ